MDDSRRTFLRTSTLGLLAAGGLVLPASAEPTPASGTLGKYGDYLAERGEAERPRGASWALTEDNILGPYYRKGAPYRAKITPPLEPGNVLLVTGRVWGVDTRKPLAGAVLDIWQANASGRYDNDDANHPPPANLFVNRARLVTDEQGGYEFETVHPGAYQTGPNQWRPSHIHYMVRAPGYTTLVTQLYFEGDKYNATDQFIKKSLIVRLQDVTVPAGKFQRTQFDIILAKA